MSVLFLATSKLSLQSIMSRRPYGQISVFANLPVKSASRLRAKRRFLGFARAPPNQITVKPALSLPFSAHHQALHKKNRMIRNKSQIIRFFNLRPVCQNILTNYLLTLNLSVSFFKLSAISRKSETCCVNSSIVARTSSEFAETSSVPAAFSCVEAEMLSSPSSTLP